MQETVANLKINWSENGRNSTALFAVVHFVEMFSTSNISYGHTYRFSAQGDKQPSILGFQA